MISEDCGDGESDCDDDDDEEKRRTRRRKGFERNSSIIFRMRNVENLNWFNWYYS
jgi:hypothetical protein